MKIISAFTCIHFLLFSFVINAQQGEWTWMNGSKTENASAVYGVKGIPDTANTPPALYECARWKDKFGNFWIYAGSNLNGSYADLWEFNPITNMWTWIKGPGNVTNTPGVWGTQGIPSSINTPGPRRWSPACWTDSIGDLWLMGGYGVDVNGLEGEMNDLWKFNIASNEWVWVTGKQVANDTGTYGIIGIPDINNNPPAMHEAGGAWSDDKNSFWLFGGFTYDIYNFNFGKTHDILWQYKISTNEWTYVFGNKFNTEPVYGTLGVPSILNNPGSRAIYASFKDATGNLYSFGGYSSNGYFNDVWKYDVATGEWTWVIGETGTNNETDAGALCEEDTSFNPKGRYENRSFWWDDCGNVYFFGGVSNNYLGDLWHLNLNTLEWSFVNGSLNNVVSGIYGTLGVSSPQNRPRGRSGGMSWTDNKNNLWLFGGLSDNGMLNDMCRYVPDSSCTYIKCNQQKSSPFFSATDNMICENVCNSYFDASTNNPVSWKWTFEGGSPSTSTLQNPTNICYQDPGAFDVTLITTDGGGNKDTLVLDNYITVYSNPFAPSITQNGNVLSSSFAYSYQWQLDGNNIPGATNQSYTITVSGLYTVIVSDENSCASQASYSAILSGIENVNQSFSIQVFPNPSYGVFSIEIYSAAASAIYYEITNAIGQIIFSGYEKLLIGENKIGVDLSESSSGIYLLKISSPTDLVTAKIIHFHK